MTGKSVAQEYAEVREQEHKRSEERRQKRSGNGADAERGVSLDDFWAYMVQHAYIFAPTGDLWPGSSVNARIPPIQVGIDDDGKPVMVSAAAWLDRNKPVEQMTWAPGDPAIITGRLIFAWRLDSAEETPGVQSVSAAADHARQRPRSSALARSHR